MNMLKCPKCGGCVPEGNEVCNHCGHRMFLVSNNGMKKSISGSGCIVFIVIMMFMMPFVIAIIEDMDVLNEILSEVYDTITEDNSTSKEDNYYDDNENDYFEEKDDYYNDDFNSDYEDDYYNDDSDYEDNIFNDNSSINNYISGDVSSWYQDVTSGKTVVSVICDINIRDCITYSTITSMSSFEKDYILHFFNINYLNDSDKNILLNTYSLSGYSSNNNNKPYTFIVKDGRVSAKISGMMYQTAYENFLIENGVISK